MQLDQRTAGDVGLEVADGPRRRSGRRDTAENLVPGARVRGRNLLPAAGSVFGHDGELIAALAIERRTDDPWRSLADSHAADVGEAASDMLQQLRGPHAMIEVLDERAGLVGGV